MHVAWGFVFVCIQLLAWFSIIAVEHYESRTGRISARRPWNDPNPFPYFWDWYTTSWGDLIGLSCIDWSAGYAFSSVTPSSLLIALSLVLGAAGASIFHALCTSKRHRPDSGYPMTGKTSMRGYLHEFYFGLQLALCVPLIAFGFEHILDTPAFSVALFGGAVYIANFLFDVYLGYYNPLPA